MITSINQQQISDLIQGMDLCQGLGDEHSACSIAAINLAMSGRLTDDIPQCMSEAIGRWIIRIQDAMPHSMRNSTEWKTLLPQAAGTGRELEPQRVALIMNWMWQEVLPLVQPQADQQGFGDQWRAMCELKTSDAADAAYAAYAARAAARAAYAAAAAAYAARAAARAAYAADAAYAAYAARAADAADAAAHAAYAAADAAARAARAAAYAAADAALGEVWPQINPAGLLRRLIDVTAL